MSVLALVLAALEWKKARTMKQITMNHGTPETGEGASLTTKTEETSWSQVGGF